MYVYDPKMPIIKPKNLDVNKIVDGLYQGAWPPFGDQLAKRGFDVLVLCAEENQHDDLYTNVQVILAPGEDDARPQRMELYLPTWIIAAQRAANAVKKGKNVLVTCMAGLNRSGMVTAMTLYLLTGWSGADIVEHVQACRLDALCNATFAAWLIDNLPASDNPQLPSLHDQHGTVQGNGEEGSSEPG